MLCEEAGNSFKTVQPVFGECLLVRLFTSSTIHVVKLSVPLPVLPMKRLLYYPRIP